ncbi:Ig-like domain-containing protein, partial [Vibrio sp. 10N.261.48.A2]
MFNASSPDTAAYTFSMTVTESDGSWRLDTTTLAQGTYQWTVVATDAAGNTSEASSTHSLVIDTEIVGFDAGLDSSTDSGSSDSDDITNAAQVKLSGQGEVGATVTLTSLVNSTTGVAVTIPTTTATVDSEG